MRCGKIIFALFLLCGPALSAEQRPATPQLEHFEIGRHTFIDVGPPNDFYELFIVRAAADGTSIERFTLTPAGDACVAPARLETAYATSSESVAALLGSANPCAISEEALQRELKRRKKGLVFSGADIAMRFQCGPQPRIIRADILDRDMFDSAPNTPENTSWTMRLLERLDQAIGGPGVLDKPIFSIPGGEKLPAKDLDPEALRHLGAGDYDALFQGPDKASDLYRAAQIHAPLPSVRLLTSVPVRPEVFALPEYPPLARLAHIEGVVSFKIEIESDGSATNLTYETGHPILRAAVKNAVSGWKFPKDSAHQQVQAVIEFALNCTKGTK